jgi:soluble lytic murein transglycosylase-like protein
MRKLLRIFAGFMAACMFGCLVDNQAVGAVYTYTDESGSVSLSNVPVDNRYQVLIDDQKRNVGEAIKEVLSVSPPLAAQKSLTITERKIHYSQIVDHAARTYGLDSALLHAVISVESRYNSKAVSRKGAVGLMQLMPETALRYGVTDSFDPTQNIDGGARYLRDLLKIFNEDVRLALAAYNAGENMVVKYGNRIPPIRETREYVPKVLGFYRKYQIKL